MGWETGRIDAPPTVGGSEERGVFRAGDFGRSCVLHGMRKKIIKVFCVEHE